MKLKVFTQPSCPRCPAAKDIAKRSENKFKVEYHDITTEDGLAEALSYDIMSTPSIVIISLDNEVMAEWRGTVPTIEALDKFSYIQ